EQAFNLLRGIAVKHEDLPKMGASGPKEIKAIRFGFSQRLFMAKNNSRRIILKLPQSDESPALGFSVPARNCKALRVNVNRGLRVLKKNALPPPIAKKIRRARVRALSGMVSCLLLAQNDANQVIGARRVITVLHLWRDLVVRLCHDVGQRNPCGIQSSLMLPREHPFLGAFLSLSLVLTFWVPTVAAQGVGTTDDVHVTPRVLPDPAPAKEAVPAGSSFNTHSKPYKVDADLVLVPVTITDPMNRLVTGLDKENFNVYEGKEAQEIKHFSSEDAPVSLGVIFDMSGSMSSKIERAREAVVEFFKTANPQDEFFMITFADKPEEISDFTQSVEDIQ